MLNSSDICAGKSHSENGPSTGDSIKVLSTPDLYNLSTKWASEYNRLYPEMKIKVISVSDIKTADKFLSGGNIGFVSNDYYSGFNNQLFWKIVIGRDVIVPVINSKNPFSEILTEHGISPESFANLLKSSDASKWGTLLQTDQNSTVNYYWINDESIKTGLKSFLKTDQIMTGGTEVKNAEKMISAIQKDPYAIGFCKMIDILDSKNQTIVENIRLLPIDRNGNGIIDYSEKIYDDFNTLSRGVWIGKYPKTLFSNIYSVSSARPKNDHQLAFLKWILTDGQQYLYRNGYSDLLISERQSAVDNINTTEIYASSTMDERSLLKTILFFMGLIIVSGIIVGIYARYRRRKKALTKAAKYVSQIVLDENSILVPKGLYFDKTHTWAFMEQNGIVKIGIDDFLQHITGTITRIKMKNLGKEVKKGEQILSVIQNGKQLNLYAPVSGIITEQNKKLETNSSIINFSPYTEGWIYKIEPTNWHRENQLLFVAEKHRQFIIKEFTRLKDFLALALKSDTEKYNQVVLQDGGELKDGVLSNLGPEVWEDFQTNFIDPSRQLWFYELI